MRRATAKLPATGVPLVMSRRSAQVLSALLAERSKGLKLDRDGKLAIPEAEVERTIEAFLRAEGWEYIHTKAENVKRSGAPAHAKYTLDALAVRALAHCNRGMDPGLSHTFYLELKKRRATTAKARLKGQTDTVEWLRSQGFLVYQAKENDPDPVGSFEQWYIGNWRHRL
jgi:hypothetical protein